MNNDGQVNHAVNVNVFSIYQYHKRVHQRPTVVSISIPKGVTSRFAVIAEHQRSIHGEKSIHCSVGDSCLSVLCAKFGAGQKNVLDQEAQQRDVK